MPTFSLVMTLHERPVEVLQKVFAAIPENAVDELVVVFDRTPAELRGQVTAMAQAQGYSTRARFVSIEGEPGWMTPVRSWNAGFETVTSEYAICFSSEVIFAPGSFEAMKRRLSGYPCVVYGKCEDSGELGPVTPSADNPLLLCSAKLPRPLGFIYGLPAWALRVTGGMDMNFLEGYFHDDDDWCMQLWSLGLPFVFVDDVAGVHQAHPRPSANSEAIQKKMAHSRQVMNKKWGSLHPWKDTPKQWAAVNGVTIAVCEGIGLLRANWEKLLRE